MGTRVSYPAEIKIKAIEMRLAGIPVKEVLSQLKRWMRWYKNGEMYRF
ncbi:Transposase [Priestia megaterium]